MKQTIFLFLGIILTYIIIGNSISNGNIIPDEAIRIRVIANSNSDYDQKIKYDVKDSIEKDIYDMLSSAKNIDTARYIIKQNLGNIENNISNTLNSKNYNLPFNVDFGLNYFPKKEFKGVTYNEGYYESLVVTLGNGEGNNWWCVLFPPLCLIEAEESSDVEYTTMVKTIIDKYF